MPGTTDIRMKGFRDRSTVEETLEAALDGIVSLPSEPVSVMDAAGRVLARDVVSAVDVPAFRRSMMDGYAVQAEDTYGATAYNPIALRVVGRSMPGTVSGDRVTRGHCVAIVTGAPMPNGADAVLMVENTSGSGDQIEATAPVPVGRNVGRIGEDVSTGDPILNSGRILLPQDVGLLSSIGHEPIEVVGRPVVRIIVSGDELLPPGASPRGTKIVDSNSPMLSALVERDGGIPEIVRLRDEEGSMEEALARPGADTIITAGAASVGSEDRVPILVDRLGSLPVHGITMRPSAPTGVGTIVGIRVVILPGNPVSCLAAYDFFAGPVVRSLGGRSLDWPYLAVRRTLARRIVSQIGRTDYVRVLVDEDSVNPIAISGSSVLSSVTRASGFMVVPSALEGYPEGTEVTVHCYHGDCNS